MHPPKLQSLQTNYCSSYSSSVCARLYWLPLEYNFTSLIALHCVRTTMMTVSQATSVWPEAHGPWAIATRPVFSYLLYFPIQ